MPYWRKFHVGGRLVVLIAVCLALPACGNKDGQANDKNLPKDGANQAAQALKVSIGKCTRIGKVREFNEDAIAINEFAGSTLCLAADGMGAQVGGKVLGQIACERAFEVLTRELKKSLPQAGTSEEIRKVIRRAIVTANEDLIAFSANDLTKNMGTTVVLALWHPHKGMYIAGVGDSRAYLVRGNKIEQLTVDHSLAQALVDNKTITAHEAKTHRFRNVLWKYLGSKEVGDAPEVKVVSVQARDRVLLCTDGIHATLADERILRFIDEHADVHADVQKCADGLCQLAVEAGSRDNVSCVVIEMIESK